MASIQHLVNQHVITTAQSIATRGKVHKLPDDCSGLTAECIFVDGGDGTTITVYIQTGLDASGSTAVDREPQVWIDIMAFRFTTAAGRKILKVREETAIVVDYEETVDALTVDTAVSGIIGSHVRARIVTTGTYTAVGADSSINVFLRIEHGNS
jgi:hypothetical protein